MVMVPASACQSAACIGLENKSTFEKKWKAEKRETKLHVEHEMECDDRFPKDGLLWTWEPAVEKDCDGDDVKENNQTVKKGKPLETEPGECFSLA